MSDWYLLSGGSIWSDANDNCKIEWMYSIYSGGGFVELIDSYLVLKKMFTYISRE